MSHPSVVQAALPTWNYLFLHHPQEHLLFAKFGPSIKHFCFHRPANERPTEGDEGHDEDLGPGAEEDRQQHSLFGRSENISMDQLPPKLLLSIFLEKGSTDTHTWWGKSLKEPKGEGRASSCLRWSSWNSPLSPSGCIWLCPCGAFAA